MILKTKKLPHSLKLPALAIGTNLMGGQDYGPPEYDQDELYITSIQEAIKLGYRQIDTAEVYGRGHTEELVGKAIKNFDRSKLFITTKVCKEHLRYEDVIASLNGSLKRLGTNYVDLLLIHAPNPEIPIKETIEAMNYLIDQKLVRYIGVSSFNIAQIKEAQKYSKHPIIANQIKYSLWAKIDMDTIKYCQDQDIIVIGYKVFGRGKMLTHKIPQLAELAKKYNKTEAQIVLNWMVSKKNVIALFKSTDSQHLKENTHIFDFKLNKKETEILDSLVHTEDW